MVNLANMFLVVGASALLGTMSAAILPEYYSSQIPLYTQYHSQNNLGQYSYGYNEGSSIKSEVKNIDGVVSGAYAFLDDDGKIQRVDYIADDIGGYRAAASAFGPNRETQNHIEDTPEVTLAKLEHLAAHRQAKLGHNALNNRWNVIGPSYAYTVRVNQ